MSNQIPVFKMIIKWDEVIIISDKEDYEYEITNVGAFENALQLKHSFDSFDLKYLNTHTFGQYAMDEDELGFNMCGELNSYFEIPEHKSDFDNFFECTNLNE